MITQTELDSERIKYHSEQTLPQKVMIERYVTNWLDVKNEEREEMIRADKYYSNKDIAIDEKKRFYLDKDGMPIEFNKRVRRNNKLKQNYFKKLVDQKIDYLLANGVMATTENEELQNILDEVITDAFNKRYSNKAREAVKKGLAWWYIYYNEEGELKYKLIPREEVIPLWTDSEHDKLDAIIRVYSIVDEQIDRSIVKTKVEYHNLEGIEYYEFKEGKLIHDPDMIDFFSPHFVVSTENGDVPVTWNKLPWVYTKYNNEEVSLLREIETIQDDYNMKRSEFSDVLSDHIRDIIIFRNYGGASLAEANEGMFKHFAAKVDTDGGVESLKVDIDTEAHKTHTELLRKDIYEFGRGVNLDDDKFGNSPSGVALRILYSDLDMDCNMFATELKSSLSYFMYFVLQDRYGFKKSEEEIEEMINQITWEFKKNMLINEKELIEALGKSNLSEQTQIERNPYAAKDEAERIKKEEEQMFDYYPVGDTDEENDLLG